MAPGTVQITPETSTIRINGRIALADNAFRSGQFQLSARDVSLDRQLGTALPQVLKPFYAALSPAGRFDLDLENVKILDANTDGKYIDFVGVTRFKDCNLDTSPAITRLDAALRIKALYKTGQGFQNGRATFTADNLRISGKSLTNLKAHIDYEPKLRSWLTKNLVADCYGGKLTGRFELKQPSEKTLAYLLQTGFENIDLKQFLLSDAKPEQAPHDDYTTGRMNGSLNISAVLGDNRTRLGTCRLTIEDMRIGRLSPLAKLLHVLKPSAPRDFAFDSMFIDSYIKSDGLLFERFDLSGETLAFNGSGRMDLQNWSVDLLLTARGSRLATAEPSVLQSLAEGLGQGVVQMEVTGSAYDPQITIRTLPAIRDTLKILGTKQATPN